MEEASLVSDNLKVEEASLVSDNLKVEEEVEEANNVVCVSLSLTAHIWKCWFPLVSEVL